MEQLEWRLELVMFESSVEIGRNKIVRNDLFCVGITEEMTPFHFVSYIRRGKDEQV